MTQLPGPRPRVFVPLEQLGCGPVTEPTATHEVHAGDLDAVAAAATTLSRWLLAPPEAKVLSAALEPEVLAGWPLPGRGHTSTGLAALRRARQEEGPADIASDHRRLLTGPGSLLAPPYESVHRSAEGLLFDEHTLRVREWYHHYGISAPREGKEPDDHIGLELEFVATLLGWSLEAHDAGSAADAAAYAEAAGVFLDEHVARWAPALFALVIDHARTDFYRGVAHLGLGLLDEAGRIWPAAT